MADTSPGKVQTLRSFFSEKEIPVMSMMQPDNRSIGSEVGKPCKWVNSTVIADAPEGALHISVTESPNNAPATKHKILPTIVQRTTLTPPRNNSLLLLNSASNNMTKACKPEIPKKPVLQMKSNSSNQNRVTMFNENSSDGRFSNLLRSENATLIESINTKIKENIPIEKDQRNNTVTVQRTEFQDKLQKLGTSEVESTSSSPSCTLRLSNFSFECQNLSKSCPEGSNISDLVSAEACVWKSNTNLKKKILPPRDKLGPPPLKPNKPPLVEIPTDLDNLIPPLLPDKPMKPLLSCLHEPVPPKPSKVVPLPPSTSPLPSSNSELPTNSLSPKLSNVSCTKTAELPPEEDLYEDTLVKEPERPTSLIPEYTEEEELGFTANDELYDDTGMHSLSSFPVEKPKNPPPPPPPPCSRFERKQINCDTEELYQDATTDNTGEFYEEMPNEVQLGEENVPLYGNMKRDDERLQKEEKRLRKELKEKEKKVKEIKKRFGLTGEEIPIDTRMVKADCRGGRHDLQVKKGEIVHILRMESNPSGKWLVKNEAGKIGYVELSNIEVDADSVKSVMSDRRLSQQTASDEPIYSDTRLEEDMYEMTY